MALDNQNQFAEAATLHKRAVAAAPRSADIMGNYGNHLLATGAAAAARDTFLKVVALDPANAGANLQLARLAVQRKQGAEALRYLQRLPAVQLDAPAVALVRLDALYLSGDQARADALAGKLASASEGDAALSFSVGLSLAGHERFALAEKLFARVLAVAPADFNVLFNLGAVAASAGHYERAREVLETARQQQPENVEVLFRLAGAHYELSQWQQAAVLLAQASRLAPQRADIQKLLALTTTSLGALDDGLAAWDAYLKLQPSDEIARRDRAYTAVRMGQLENGIVELERYVGRHPDDAAGHFQLGMAQGQTDAAKGLAHLDRAIALRPDFAEALSARGALNYQQGKPEAAVKDLESAAKLRPRDATNLDRLGQTYLALDRTADSVRTLRQAAELAPSESRIQLHFARALGDAGQTQESREVMERFRQLGPATKQGVPAGFVEFLSLTPAQRRADYRGRVEKAVREKPDDIAAQLAYLKLLLEDLEFAQAEAVVRELDALKVPAGLQAEFAITRAQVRDATGHQDEAIAELEALDGKPLSLDLRWQAAGTLLRNGRKAAAFRLFQDGAEPEALLMKAVLLIASGDAAQAAGIIDDLQGRRPEWSAVWVARAALQMAQRQPAEARRSLETAAALGARNSEPGDLPTVLLLRPLRDW